jgi:tetratricopeptide (TPR) repeat protein
VDDLLRAAIAAARSGQREHARELLLRFVEQDEKNVLAWLWLSSVVDGLEDREICLENVLALEPNHDVARQGLAWVRKQKEASDAAEPDVRPALPPPPSRAPVSAAAAVLQQDFARRRPPPQPPPEPPPIPPRDEFEDEYVCPYCAAQTAPDDRTCPNCAMDLWIKVRRRRERSPWLWVALTIQAASIIWPAFLSLLALYYAGQQAGLDNFFRLVPVYLGFPSDLPIETISAAFEVIPRAYVLPLALYISFSLAVTVGLYLRWKPVFYLYLLNALLVLGSAIAGLAFGLGLPGQEMALNQRVAVVCSGGGLILGLLMFFLVLQLEDDFFSEEKRLLTRLDRDATSGPALLGSGRRYARRGMWAMAAIHLRRATAEMSYHIDPYLALVVAYLNLNRDDLAASVLAEARRINPHDPELERLTVVLESRRNAARPQ